MTITDDVRTDQRLLNLAGFKAGAVDGVVGPKTRAAYERWREAEAAMGEVDERSVRNIRTLLPQVQVVVRDWLLEQAYPAARELGYVVKVICGTRSWKEQEELYAKGRTAPGPRVTNAKAGSSWHNYGVAWDVGLFTASGGYVSDGKVYERFGKLAGLPVGCEWGGNWKSFKDFPHYQWVQVYGSLARLKAYSKG